MLHEHWEKVRGKWKKNRVARNIDKPFVIEFRRQTILSALSRNAKVKQYQYVCRPVEERFPCNWCGFQVVLVVFFSFTRPHLKQESWAQFDTIPKRTIYQIMDIKLMRMRLAHKWIIRNRQKRQTERMEHKFMFYDYFMIFMDRILCDRNLFIFFFFFFWVFCCCFGCTFLATVQRRSVFPKQFIIDIMLSLASSAHVQEMWDRLCFYCVASMKWTGIWLQSTIGQKYFTFHILLANHLSHFFSHAHTHSHTPNKINNVYLHLSILFGPQIWLHAENGDETISKVIVVTYLRMWIGHSVCQNFCHRTQRIRCFVDFFDPIVIRRFVNCSPVSWVLYFVALNLGYLNPN